MNLGNAVLSGAIVGGVNYFLTSAFTRINPVAGLICGAAAGFIGGIVARPSWAELALQIILSAGISTLVCAGMNIPITFKTGLLLTAMPFAATICCLLILGTFGAALHTKKPLI